MWGRVSGSGEGAKGGGGGGVRKGGHCISES